MPSNEDGRSRTVVCARGRDSLGLDPGTDTNGESWKVIGHLFEGLLSFQPASFDLVPGLATAWEVRQGGSTYIFHLRPNVRFHSMSAWKLNWYHLSRSTGSELIYGARLAYRGPPKSCNRFGVRCYVSPRQVRLRHVDRPGMFDLDSELCPSPGPRSTAPDHCRGEGHQAGAILPKSNGQQDMHGKACEEGFEMARADFNAKHAADGLSLEIRYVYTNSSVKEARDGALHLLADKEILAILGDVFSDATMAALEETTKARIIQFSPASTTPELTGISPYFFRNALSDVHEMAGLAWYAAQQPSRKRVAILYVNTTFGRGLNSSFSKVFRSLGGTVVASESYPYHDNPIHQLIELLAREFRAPLEKLMNNSPDSLLLAGNTIEMGVAVKLARELGFRGQIFANTDFNDSGGSALKFAGNSAEGVVIATPAYDPIGSGDKAMRDFAERFQRLHGDRMPKLLEAASYDAVNIVVNSIMGGGRSADLMRAYISALKDYPGAAGKTTFERGDVIARPISIFTVKNHAFVLVRTISGATPALRKAS